VARAYCFIGPSLPEAAATAAASDIQVLPPVAAGDLLRLGARFGDIVGIVDGYFHQTGSVRHKEILALLDEGVRVMGAASMGALRAAELDRFGMEGLGSVYADYRDGRLEADDEVTLLHSPAEDGYRAHSEPLVCMRATLAEAVRQGVCDARTAGRIVDVLARRPYTARSYSALSEVGKEAGVNPPTLLELRRFCLAHRRDPKREDALLLLRRMAAVRDQTPTPVPKRHAVNRTAHLYTWQLAARCSSSNDAAPRTGGIDELHAFKLFADDFPTRYREMVLRTLADECERECGSAAEDETPAERALRHGAHRGLYRLPADRARLGFLDHWLTPAESRLPVSGQLLTFLVRSCRTTLMLPWDEMALDQIMDPAALSSATRFVRWAFDVNDSALKDRPDLSIDTLKGDRIRELLASRWGVPNSSLDLAALDRGFSSTAGAVTAARPFYLLARYNAEVRIRPSFLPASLRREGI
jgi:hypothetical protein